jgi:hypothetical protein
MSSIPRKVRIAVVGALVVAGLLMPAGSASAQTLNGIWAPFNRCPVDSPVMLATDGVSSDPTCIAATSPSGSIKLGNTTATTGATDLQLGAAVDDATGAFTLVTPSGGALVSDPVNVPGGLLGLMCPSDIPLVTALCQTITNSELNRVTATVVPAGQPSDFNRIAALIQGQPIITLPVKVHLEHPLLAPTCHIGSDSDPIVLRPENTTQPSLSAASGDLDGTPNPTGALAVLTGVSTQGDDTFAVPGAQGCGLLGLIDTAINAQQGLPSPSGNNELVLNNASAGLITESAQGPLSGQQFSDAWHSAVLP